MPWAGRIEDFRGQSGYNIAIAVLEHSCHRCTYRYMEEDPSNNSLERTREAGRESMNGGGFMKSYREELWFDIPGRRALINITPQVEACLGNSGIKEGRHGQGSGRDMSGGPQKNS